MRRHNTNDGEERLLRFYHACNITSFLTLASMAA